MTNFKLYRKKERSILTQIIKVNIDETIDYNMGYYGNTINTTRAFPDVRDGLKFVGRRIMYTLHELNIGPKSQHRKVAKVVGDVMGNYHPCIMGL